MEQSDWTEGLKAVERKILELDAIPQLGHLPPFPYQALEEALSTQFQLPSLRIGEEVSRWMSKEEATEGLGSPLTHIPLACPPLEGEMWLSLSTEELQQIMHTLLGGDPFAPALYDSDLKEGFVNYIATLVLKACRELDYPLSPILAAKKPLSEGPFFVRQLTVEGFAHPLHPRLLLSSALCQAIRSHFEAVQPKSLSPELAAALQLSLSLEIGQIALSMEEWQELQEGDYISLDSCTVDAAGTEGTATLSTGGRPLFVGEMGPQGVTITHVSGYQEEAKD